MIFQDLTKRMISAVISLLTLSVLLVYSFHPLMRWVIAVCTALMGMVAMWECIQLSLLKGEKKRYQIVLMCKVAILIIGFFISTIRPSYAYLPFALFFLVFISLFCFRFSQIKGCTAVIAQSLFALVYIGLPLGLILKILYFSNFPSGGQEGRYFLIYLIAVTKITDTGAYFGGRIFGNKKLAEKISPGKTVVGSLIGLLSACFLSLLFYALSALFSGFDFSFLPSLWLGALIGVIGQVGDLAESILKRDAHVKDSNSMPGLGGALDMLDSLLFTTPLVYLFLLIFRS